MRPPNVEQGQVRLVAPHREQAQVCGVAPAGAAAVSGEEAGHGDGLLPHRVVDRDDDDADARGHGALLGQAADGLPAEDITASGVIERTCSCRSRAPPRHRPSGATAQAPSQALVLMRQLCQG